jgi:nucleotide sugar dehydrogenase
MQYEAAGIKRLAPIVAVVGLGKIGLPLAVQYARHGRGVIGCDINPLVVEMINAGKSHVQEEPELTAEVCSLVSEHLLSATQHTTWAVQQAKVVVVIVPVIVDEQHRVDFEWIDEATTSIGEGLRPGTLVIYETTLPVGTTARRFRPILESTSNLKAGKDFYLAYSPERVSSGHIFRDLQNYPKVVGGIDEASAFAAASFYRSVLDAEIIPMPSTNDAEFVKLIETTYRDVNIALANEYARYADAHGLDVKAAIAAANTQPYSHIHAPGVGVGGHCIPVYPYFLMQGLLEGEMDQQKLEPAHLLLPRAARQINDAMAEYAVQRVEAEVGSLLGQVALMLGVAYRGDVRETAFTSAQLLSQALERHGAIVYADDPLYSDQELLSMGYTPLPEGAKPQVKAIILQADHAAYQAFDFSAFAGCQVLLDGRRGLDRETIEAAGIRYIAIGDGQSLGHQRAAEVNQLDSLITAGREG